LTKAAHVLFCVDAKRNSSVPNTKGFRLSKGQFWSEDYPGWIVCQNGKYRFPFFFKGKHANRYSIKTECVQCKKSILQDIVNNKKSKNSFCSQDCKSIFVKSQNYGNKSFRKRDHGNHVLVNMPEHPRADHHGRVYEHVIVAGNKIGRNIKPTERIHHINCVKDDNSPENLFVCADNKEHLLIHGSLNRCVKELMDLGVLKFNETEKKYEVNQ
jgi:hypothetical protein